MVSVLTRIFGTENLETAEDVVQDTLLHAMQVWKLKGIPDNPSAWLFRVAKNKAIDIIRRNKRSQQYDFTGNEKFFLTSEYTLEPAMNNLWKDELVKDDQLRMMFACCHPGISEENQVTLILKTLCGFSTAEIAKTFLTSEDTVSKRLYRAKEFFRETRVKFELPDGAEIQSRVLTVLNTVYLLFNEGYNSTHSEEPVRKDLMEEAMLLCHLLTENTATRIPETHALLALMCFHSSRNDSRVSPEGELILLHEQDRTRWNQQLIELGNDHMNKAATGNTVSHYHIEAAIAFEHCTAESFEKTNWKKILGYYEWLYKMYPSPVTALNQCVAVMQVHGANAALEALGKIPGKEKLYSFYLYYSLLGETNARLKKYTEAKKHFEKAMGLTLSEAEKKLLQNKLDKLPE